MCRGTELYNEIQKQEAFDETDAASILKKLIETVAYCHNKGIMHRDIKPENIMVEQNKKKNWNLKLIDFGTGYIFMPGEVMKTAVGTPPYIAPEIL